MSPIHRTAYIALATAYTVYAISLFAEGKYFQTVLVGIMTAAYVGICFGRHG